MLALLLGAINASLRLTSQEQYDCFVAHLESDLNLGAFGHTKSALLTTAPAMIAKWQSEAVVLLPNRSWCYPNFVQERALPIVASYAGPIWYVSTQSSNNMLTLPGL
jgi:hypothetical protein